MTTPVRSRGRFTWVTTLSMALAFGLSFACADQPFQQPCHNIPGGGCPGGDLAVCVDPTCAAIYACEPDGTWSLVGNCPPSEGGVDGGAPLDAAEASFQPDVDIDVPGAWGGPGCPDLQSPDCPLGLATQCNDCCGCEDLFVCTDGGWSSWGLCVDGGIQPEQ